MWTQRLARDAAGRLWLAWQTVADDLHYEVMAAELTASGLAAPENVSDHADDDWEPAICATADDRIVIAWDTYRNGSYDILVSRLASEGFLPGARHVDQRLSLPSPE